MSVKSYWYTQYFKQIWQNSPSYGGWQPIGGDSFNIALCPTAYRPHQDTHAVLNDIIQVSGQGYTAGGQLLANKTISMATGALALGADPVSWSGCTFNVRYAVIYDNTNVSPLAKQLVRWIDFGQDISLAGGSITITFNGEGEIIVTPPPGDTIPPTLSTASVDGPALTLTYNETMDTTSVPATAEFAVLVNGGARGVSTVSIASTQVALTLASPVVAADVVTISYTTPATNPLRDIAFNLAATFLGLSVQNVTLPSPPDPPLPDVTPPVVTITSPLNGAVVSDTITVTATATDLNGVVSVVLYTDGVSFSTDTSSPYSFGMDTKTLSNGAHALVARAIDPSGNIGVSATVNVTVSNVTPPLPDTTPPTVSITSPLSNAILAGTFTVAAIATDDVGVVSATLYVDGVSQGVDPSQPYSFALNTTLLSDGAHTLVATAIDAATNVGTSATVSVAVDNTIPALSNALINGATLTLNYNETLNPASVPLTSAFAVKTDGNTRTLNSIAVSGSQVLITLSVAVLAINVVTVSYTAPTGAGAKPIQDRAGNNAVNLVDRAVTNQTPGDTTPPIITALSINAAALTIQYNENMDTTSVPAVGAFAVTVNAVARTVNSVAISGQNVTLTLSSAVISTDTVVASYTQPTTNKLRDLGQVNAASFFNLPVQNTTPPVVPPEPPAPVLNTVSSPDAQTLIWNNTNVANETGYDYETSPNGTSSWTLRGTRPVDTVTFTWTGAVENTQYFMRVSSIGPSGTRYPSNVLNVTTPPGVPPQPPEPTAPSLTSVSAPLSTSVTWNHTNVTDEFGYEYSTAPASSGPWTLRGTSPANSTTFTWAQAVQLTTYFMRVSSFGAAGTRYPSNVLSVTTPATPIVDAASFVSQFIPSLAMNTATTQNVSVTMRNDGTATWTAAAGYHLYSQNSAGNTRWGLSQVPVPGSVIQNGNAVFPFSITAPSTAGSYAFQWRMRHNTTEFGSQSQNATIVVSVASSGNTYYVSTTGSNLNSGTQVAPFRTINYGLGFLNPGDTLLIQPGVYAETLRDVIPSGNNSYATAVTVKSVVPLGAILRPTIPGGGIIEFNAARHYIIIDGLTLDAVNGTGNAFGLSTSSNTADNFHHIRITGCEIKNCKGDGITSTGAAFMEVLNTLIHDVGPSAPGLCHGIYASSLSHDWLIEGCDIYNSIGYGIQIYDGSNTMYNFVVRQNRLHACYNSGIVIGGLNGQVYNNLCYANRGNGVRIRYSTANGTKVYFNSIYNNGFGGGFSGADASGISDGGANSIIRNNITLSNAGGAILCDGCSGNTWDHNLTAGTPTAIWTSPSTNNFHLLSTATGAINQGIAIAGITTDFDDVTRGNPPDIGAYEFV